MYLGSAKWVCNFCKWQDDIHGVRNHIPHCDKNPDRVLENSETGEDSKN
jgi:hypothetical protein